MAGITGKEDGARLVSKAAGNALTDLVAAKPLDGAPLDREGRHDFACLVHDEALTEVVATAGEGCMGWARLEFDVEAGHVAFSGHDEDGAVFFRVDECFGPDVGKVGDEFAVEDAPYQRL